MPQLNPAPWFLILLASWGILIIMSLAKVSKHLPPNTPLIKPLKPAATSWTWPWP